MSDCRTLPSTMGPRKARNAFHSRREGRTHARLSRLRAPRFGPLPATAASATRRQDAEGIGAAVPRSSVGVMQGLGLAKGRKLQPGPVPPKSIVGKVAVS